MRTLLPEPCDRQCFYPYEALAVPCAHSVRFGSALEDRKPTNYNKAGLTPLSINLILERVHTAYIRARTF